MQLSPEVTTLLSELAVIAARNTAASIGDRVRSITAKRADKETQSELLDIINDLVEEKTRLVSIAQGLRSELAGERISEQELGYIQENLIPLIEKLLEETEEDSRERQALLDLFKPVLSKETFSILQLIGFNIRAAVGEPLTEISQRAIRRRVPSEDMAAEVQVAVANRDTAFAQLARDPEAFRRFTEAFGQ